MWAGSEMKISLNAVFLSSAVLHAILSSESVSEIAASSFTMVRSVWLDHMRVECGALGLKNYDLQITPHELLQERYTDVCHDFTYIEILTPPWPTAERQLRMTSLARFIPAVIDDVICWRHRPSPSLHCKLCWTSRGWDHITSYL